MPAAKLLRVCSKPCSVPVNSAAPSAMKPLQSGNAALSLRALRDRQVDVLGEGAGKAGRVEVDVGRQVPVYVVLMHLLTVSPGLAPVML